MLQALFSLDAFRTAFGCKNEFKRENCFEFRTQFCRIGDGLTSGEYSKPIEAISSEGKTVRQSDEQMGISPGLFKAVVAVGNADFMGNQQQGRIYFIVTFSKCNKFVKLRDIINKILVSFCSIYLIS